MRLLKILFTTFICCLLLGFAVSQTKWAEHQIKERMIAWAEKRGLELSFDSFEEFLPFKWTLKEVGASFKKGKPVRAKTLVVRLSYFPFRISSADIFDGNYNGVPFTAKAHFTSSSEISSFYIDNPHFHLNGSAILSDSFQAVKTDCAFQIPDLHDCFSGIAGNLQGKIQLQSEFAQITLDFRDLNICGFALGQLNADLMASVREKSWNGNLAFTSPSSIDGNLSFQFNPFDSLLQLSQIEIQGLDSHLRGQLSFDPFSLEWKNGLLHLEAHHLEHFRALLPDSFLKGSLGAHIQFSHEKELLIRAHAENLSLYTNALDFAAGQFVLSKEKAGTIKIEGNNLSTAHGYFSSFTMNSEFGRENAPFSFYASGEPLNVSIEGTWGQTSDLFSLDCNHLKGTLFNEIYQIEKPFHLEWDDHHLTVAPFLLKTGQGHLFTHLDFNKDSAFVKIEAVKLPLDFVSLFKRDFFLYGTSDFSLDLAAHDDHLSGNINLDFQNVNLISDAKKESIQLKGKLSAALNENKADLHGNMQTKCGQNMTLSAQIPLQFKSFPLVLKNNEEESFSAQLALKGKLQDLFQFINIGDQQLEGWLIGNLQFSDQLTAPQIQGTLELQEGDYENLTLGFSLKNIEARAIAAGREIKLITFKANDESKGVMSGSGLFKLDPAFSYAIDSHLNEFQALSLDTLEGTFTGHLLFTGNLDSAKAQGNLYVAEARFKIPEKLTTTIPDLAIKLINTPESLLKKPLMPLSFFPIHLDLDLTASKQVFLEWKGLTSEWKGKLHVTGNHLDVHAKGALSLLKGDYNFASKTFSITEGQMTFNDQSSPAMYLSLSGTCELPDTNVKVIVRGPLFSPSLTFQSSPTMATSALLSRILFNKDITEISTIQAFQLAQTLLSLSGDSAPNILERIRKTLFIDRLNVITSADDEILLQISKYLTKGLMLTLSQGLDTQKVTMDVELNQGFLLQAEVGKEQKGKFSLKWNHNY